MALIDCAECKKEISDKSQICIHCGYPIGKMNKHICKINGIYIDCSFVLNDELSWQEKRDRLRSLTGIESYICNSVQAFWDNNKKIPEVFNCPTEAEANSKKPHCPHCQSTNISSIGTGERVGSIAVLGIFSKIINKSFKCKSSRYTW